MTEIEMTDSFKQVYLDGHQKITSDKQCFEILRPDEVVAMLDSRLEYLADLSESVGRIQARLKIREALGLS